MALSLLTLLWCRLKPFGCRVSALRRKPWCSKPAATIAGAAASAQPNLPALQHAQQQAEARVNGDQQPPVAMQQQQHNEQLEAAALEALSDKGCWPQDSARLAADADIIACESLQPDG